jgi:hypothetical protein
MSSVAEAVPEVVYLAPNESAVSSVVSAAPEFTQHPISTSISRVRSLYGFTVSISVITISYISFIPGTKLY